MSGVNQWPQADIAKLRALWGEGVSSAQIARHLKITKNAVVGKAHRLGLPARPSPIRRSAEGSRTKRATRALRDALIKTLLPTITEPAEAPKPAPAPRIQLRPTPCCWPIGELRTPGFRFCGEAGVPGKPYCETHAAVAYVRVRDRREEAA